MQLTKEKKIFYTLRIAAAMCFIGHGIFGIITKEIWTNYFGVFGIDHHLSYRLMPIVGTVDVMMGVIILINPVRGLLAWLVLWGFITASLRPLSGEPFAEFLERAGNYGAPLALLLLTGGIGKNIRGMFSSVHANISLNQKSSANLITCLRIIVFLLFLGHGWLNLIEKKSLLDQYASLGFANPARVAQIIGIAEIIGSLSVLIKPIAPIVLGLFIWKVTSELFYPQYELFEWVERGGSYGSLLALWFVIDANPFFRKIKEVTNARINFSFKNIFSIIIILLSANFCIAQKNKTPQLNDSISSAMLDSVRVHAYIRSKNQTFLPAVQGMLIFSGKKTNIVQLKPTANLAQNNSRTAFAEIPGLTMWDMDGAGLQLNIGSRSTDSHRSIEMNMRQNGYTTNSDMFGYPENHYTVPLQAIKEVQLVRGSAALQFGPQFGGMMNFIIKDGEGSQPFFIESEQTFGSNNFFNSYNAVGGTKGKFSYYSFFDRRSGDGWRANARFNYQAYYTGFKYQFTKKISLAFQFSHMDYVQQIAGGLTDRQFINNPKQSYRARNFFQPSINIPALIFKYNVSNTTEVQLTLSGLFGQRNSVQFINTPNISDTFNLSLGSYNPRQVDRDYYNAFTTEARVLHFYKLGKIKSILAGGIRYSKETTKRRQKGVGTDGSDFDLSLLKYYATDLRLTTTNEAIFAENIFQLTKKFSITPGLRYELINTNLTGTLNNEPATPYQGKRNFFLAGAGFQYQISLTTQLYGNLSQAYRPYLYANVTPADRVDVVDPNLKDSKGYDLDFGYRGHYKNIIRFDVNAFYLFYGNRIGLLSEKDGNGNSYLLTTNIGNSVAKGVEAFIDFSVLQIHNGSKNINLHVFNSLAYNYARYVSGAMNNAGTNISVKGNRVESTPDWMNKCGIELQSKSMSTSLQYSYTSLSYNDAFNTVFSQNGVTGLIPAYHVWDWGFSWQLTNACRASAGINNISNAKYFGRRITFYPGPGILPADGRTFYVSLGVKI